MIYEMIQFSSFVPVGMNRYYVSKAQTPYLTKNIKKTYKLAFKSMINFMSILNNLKL